MVRIRRTLVVVGTLLAAVAPGSGAYASTDDEAPGEVGKLNLVLDSSGSMKEADASGTTKIRAARQALRDVVGGLSEDAQVGMRVFGATVFSRGDEGACQDSQQVVPIGTGNADELTSAIGEYKPYGETPIGYALQEAAKDLGDEGQRTIMLVSDGEATCAPDPCKVAADLAADGIDLKIDVVGFHVSGKARKQLTCVADKGNGTYYDVDDADELAATMETSSSRALQPFEVTGTPIEGTPQADGAPEMEPGGQYTDTIPSGADEKHYLVKRSEPGSNIIVGVSGRPEFADSDTDMTLGDLGIELETTDGESCSSATSLAIGDGSTALVAGTVSTIEWLAEESDSPCSQAEELQLSIAQNPDGPGQDIGDTPIQFKLWEYGEAADYDELPEAQDYENVPWEKVRPDVDQAEAVVGAGSFEAAPELEAGTSYTDTVVPGEMRLYKIPVDWGQRLQAQVDGDELSEKVFDMVDPTQRLGVNIYGPAGADATNDPTLTASDSLRSEELQAQASTMDVRYRNFGSVHDFVAAAGIPGDYYIGVAVNEDDEDESYEVSFTLTPTLVGEAGTDEPDFSVAHEPGDVPVDSGDDSADADESGDSGTSASESSDDSAFTPTTVAIGLVVVLVLVAGGFGIRRFTRRANTP